MPPQNVLQKWRIKLFKQTILGIYCWQVYFTMNMNVFLAEEKLYKEKLKSSQTCDRNEINEDRVKLFLS